MTSYSRFCYTILGEYIKPIRKYFFDLKNELQEAGFHYTLDEYLSMAIFTSILVFVVETILLSFIFGIITKNVISAILLAFALSSGFSGIIFFLFYSYPTVIKSKISEEIDRILPFATSYMSAIAAGKTRPILLFKGISKFKDYGAISKAASNIVRNVEMFGMNFADATKREALRTPSKNFREVLWGINTTLASGGDLKSFLREKANTLMGNYRREIRRYSQRLSLFIEIYLTLIITGSIFFIVLTSIMASTGGFEVVTIQSFLVFLFLPIVSIMFLILIKTKSPLGG